MISNDRYNKASPDILVAAMTSNPAPTPFGFTISSGDLAAGQLNRLGTIRVDKVFTMKQKLVVKTFGKVNDVVLDRIRAGVADLLARNP